MAKHYEAKLKKLMFIFLSSFVGIMTLMACSSMGTAPEGEQMKNKLNDKRYDQKTNTFKNLTGREEMGPMEGTLKKFFFGDQQSRPLKKMPELEPDFINFLRPSDQAKFIWFGHSSFLINMSGKIILVDPVISEYASPIYFFVKRFQKSLLDLDAIKRIDYVIISHDHYDHLDLRAIKKLKERDVKFIVPLGVGSHLKGWGVKSEKIREFDWWQEFQDEDLKFVCTPAQHFSGRGLRDKNKTLWASWIIQNKNENIYFSGDSGYSDHFKEIGNKYGPFDLTFIENGQYNKAWEYVHMLPEQAAMAHQDLGGKKMVPIHWGMFNLSIHDWFEPIEKALVYADKYQNDLITPIIGQEFTINESLYAKWWRPLVENKENSKLSSINHSTHSSH